METPLAVKASRLLPRRTFIPLVITGLLGCADSTTGPGTGPMPDPRPEEPGGLRGQVAYAVFAPAGGTWSLATRPLEGGEPIELSIDHGDEGGLPDRAVMQVRWSPDGAHLLYRSTKTFTEDWYLVLVNADGSGRRLITPYGGFAVDPEFSPAGDRVLYKRVALRPLGLGEPTQTSIVDLNGASTDVFLEEAVMIEGRRVYFDQNEDPVDALYDAQWGGDDDHLYVVGFFDAPPTASPPTIEQVEVFEVSLGTGRPLRRLTRNLIDETRFHASGDGKRLIVGRSDGTSVEALLLTAGQTEEPEVIARGYDLLPRWATDGRHISYVAPDGIWLADLDSDDQPVRLADGSGGTSSANTWPNVFVQRSP